MPADKPRHPACLKVLFFTEMWERFSFYLMLFILPLYLADYQKGGLGWTDEEAAVLIGSYMALVYFTPFIGGLLADRLLGSRKTILIGAALMMIGHLVLAIPNQVGLYLGLGFLILGNGAFKPNISTLVGNLYPPGSPLKAAGFNIFYMGINVGAFICNFVAAFVRNYFDNHPLQITSDWTLGGWHAAFGTAAIGMFIGLVIFALNYRRLAYADPDPQSMQDQHRESLWPLWIECILPAVACGALAWVLTEPGIIESISKNVLGLSEPLYTAPLKPPTAAFLGACIPVFVFYFNIWRKETVLRDRQRITVLLVMFGAGSVFWMIFHLNSTTLNVWARDNTDRVPNAAIRVITDRQKEFAENAPPSYFDNAAKHTPRPAKSTYRLVSEAEYKQLQDAKKLSVEDGKQVPVTEQILAKIYAKADSSTPTLAEREHLKLVNTELFQSINAGFVILFTPLLVAFWHLLRSRGMEPSTPGKIGLGLLLIAGVPVVMLLAVHASEDGKMKISAWWLVATYAVATFAELCLSPMGLTLVSKISPTRIRAFMMGGWFLSTAFGNKFAGIFGELYQHKELRQYENWHYVYWVILMGSALVFAGLVFALLPWLKRQIGDENA